MQSFGHIADARLDPQVIPHLHELALDGGAVHNPQPRDNYYPIWHRWRIKQDQINAVKRSHMDNYNNSYSPFYYEAYTDPVKNVLRLQAHGRDKTYLIPSPRPFHAIFSGRKKGECVGGRDCANLTPRRWATAGLVDSTTYFVEQDKDLMEGYLRTIPVKNSSGEVYEVLDIMSHAIKGSVVGPSANGPVNYSFLDSFIDQFKPISKSKGLAISDGSAVSMNVVAGDVVEPSPSARKVLAIKNLVDRERVLIQCF